MGRAKSASKVSAAVAVDNYRPGRPRCSREGMSARAVLSLLCFVIANGCGGASINSLPDGPVFEGLLVGPVSTDCNPSQSKKPLTALPALNITLTLLPQGNGISLSWYSLIDISKILQGGDVTSVPAFQIQRKLTKNKSVSTNFTECRTIPLNASAATLLDKNLMFFNYNWTHDNITARAEYDVVLLSLSSGKESDIVDFLSTLYVSQSWPLLVALRQQPVCSTSKVILSFVGVGKSSQLSLRLCMSSVGPCPYSTTIDNTQNTATFQDVRPGNYIVFIGLVASKQAGCYCGVQSQLTGNCIPCGSSLNGVNYIVSAVVPRPWQANAVLDSRCAAATKDCCIQVDFISADASLKYSGYNVSFFRTNISSRASNAANQAELSVWSMTNGASICNLSSGVYVAEIMPIGECQEWINTTFSNSVTIGEPWMPVIDATVIRCERQDVQISFTTLPNASISSQAPAYYVKLCNDYHMESCPYTMANTDGYATFKNVTPGMYSLWLSLAVNCSCRLLNGSCILCPNEAQTIVNVTGISELNMWNSNIQAEVHYSQATNSTCIVVSFQQANDEHTFSAYNLSVYAASSQAQIFTNIINYEQNSSTLSYPVCGAYSEDVIAEISPVDRCLKYKTQNLKISIGSSNLGLEVGVGIGCVAIVGFAILFIIWRCKCLPVFNRDGKRGICDYKPELENASSHFQDIESGKEDLDSFIGGQSPLVLILYTSDHELHAKIVSIVAETLQTFGGCKVVLDKWCDSEAVQMNSWLRKQMFDADKVVIVASEGASMLHRAFMSAQHFPKHSLKFSTCHHISESLSLASKYPTLRQKLVFVTFAYSPDSSVSGLLEGFVEQPRYHLLHDMNCLIGALHSAVSPYEWSCQLHFERSAKHQKVKKLIQKMLDKANRRPSFISDFFGPASDRFDSGIHHSAVARSSEFSTDDLSTGLTEAVTISGSSSEPVSKWLSDSIYSFADDEAQQQYAFTQLPTIMPNTETIWGTYMKSEPSTAGSLTAEQIRVALRRLNSDPSFSFYGSQPFEKFDDCRSDVSKSSCITISGGHSGILQSPVKLEGYASS